MTPDGKSCVDRNECLDNPCHNGGTCINRDTQERYTCLCSTGFSGQNCELMQEEQILRLSMGALAVILICLLMILSNCGQVSRKMSMVVVSSLLGSFQFSARTRFAFCSSTFFPQRTLLLPYLFKMLILRMNFHFIFVLFLFF